MDILPIPLPRSITVYCSPTAAGETVIRLVAELALCGPVTILDGGNCFPAYGLLRAIRRRTTQLAVITQQVFVRRAFTCHQMLALLEGTPCLPQPYILLNPLDTFYDEQIPEAEIRRLLEASLFQMERLAQGAPVLASITPSRTRERAFLVDHISTRARQLFMPDHSTDLPALPFRQPALF